MFDVAVIGAGPAGCRAATRLAARGARVALIDGSHPREKPCGGGVTGRALELLGPAMPLAGVPFVTIDSARFAHGSSATDMAIADDSPARRLAVVPRRSFDAALLQHARDAGAHIHDARVTHVERVAARWTISTRGGAVDAEWIIGADGPNSLVRRRVSAPFARADLSIAAGYYVHGVTSRAIEIEFLDDPAGYLWSFPRADHLAVGACAQADDTTPGPLLDVVSRWIRGRVPLEGTRQERYGWPIPSLGEAALLRERPAGEGWLLAGDAAGMVDPITREGIYFALVSGAAAADSLLECRDPARRYAARVRETVYDELVRAARLKERFFRPRFMGLLVSALARSEPIRVIMADLVAGRQTYRGLRRRLLATLELRLFRELFGW